MVAAAVRIIFAQPDADHVREQLGVIASMLGGSSRAWRRCCARPSRSCWRSRLSVGHWKKIWSTNPLERLNKEIKRQTDVVGVFPNPAALLRLAGAVLVEAHAELQVSDRRYLSEGSMATLTTTRNRTEVVAQPELIPA